MPFQTAFDKKIMVSLPTEVDGSGKPNYSTPVEHNARIQRKTDVVISSTGDEVTVSHVIYLENEIPLTAKIWLPSEDPATDSGHRPVTSDFSTGIGVSAQLTKVTI